jgi:hypothetical protein
VSNKAVLLRSVSAIATAAASTAGGVQHASAQVLTPAPGGYYYSVTGGLMFSPSERYLSEIEDKVGLEAQGYTSSFTSSYTSAGGSSYSSFTFMESSGSSFSSGLDDFAGIFGSVSFGKQIDPNWDIRGTISATNGGTISGYASAYNFFSSYTQFSGITSGGSSYWGSSWDEGFNVAGAEGEYKFGFAAADFEVGYTPVLSDTFNVRLFAGIRALAFKSTFTGQAWDVGFYESGYGEQGAFGSSSSYYSSFHIDTFSGSMQTEFVGIGPRIGAQVATRFEGTNFGLSGSVASSVLFGNQKVTSNGEVYHSAGWYSSFSGEGGFGSDSGSSYFSGSASSTAETSKTVLDLQASIGVDYYLNDSTALTVGYQAEKLFEINGDDMGVGTKIDTLTHGPFIKLGGTF